MRLGAGRSLLQLHLRRHAGLEPGILGPTLSSSALARQVPPGDDIVILNPIRPSPEEARALDGAGEFTLLLVRHGRDAARDDFAALRYVALQELHVLVVDLRRIGAGERTGLLAAEEGTARAVTAVIAAESACAVVSASTLAVAGAAVVTIATKTH